MAASTRARFVLFSAVLGGVAEVRRIVAEAQDWRTKAGRRTILFVDEIHRFNKAQQDAFLPHVENGTIVLIGATTENPSFSLNAPLLSRCIVHQLEPLEPDALVELLARALSHPRGVSGALEADDEALRAIAAMADGDGRKALQILEWAAEHARRSERTQIDRELVQELGTDKTLRYDRGGDEHYNVISAFIKSMRGSDPDAAIYWLMRMIDAGDDPLFVSRRMIIFAGEDIGTADPRALAVAVDADRAFRRIGLPEGIYALAEAAIYLACAPKSNACTQAWHRARQAIAESGALPVPAKLRNAATGLMRELGYGQGYRYPHDEPDAVARGETYLPEKLAGQRFYQPTERGLEQAIGRRLRRLRGEDEPGD